MTPNEKKAFESITDDRLRESFINLFWRMHDPTPGTPENEFRDELEERFAYVNKRFRFAGKPGWKTDRGRVYMVLGPPKSTDRYDVSIEVYPIEIWFYYGEGRPGLPSHFSVLFYKPYGTGDYKLYSYSADGPYALLIHRDRYDPFNYEQLYEKFREIDMGLASVVLSPIPGQIPFGYYPSPEGDQIIARVLTWPERQFDDTYAIKFDKYAGLVDIEESNRYITAFYLTRVDYFPELNFPILQYAIQPDVLSLGRFNDRVYLSFEVTIRVLDAMSETQVIQLTKTFRKDIDPTELQQIKAGGLLLADQFPLLPGKYQVNFLIKNNVSKEFSFYDTIIDVPAPTYPFFPPPLLAYAVKPSRVEILSPYQVGLHTYQFDLKNTFTIQDTLIIGSRIYVDQFEPDIRVRVRIFKTKDTESPIIEKMVTPIPAPSPKTLTWSLHLPLKDKTPGFYRIETSLMQGNTVLKTYRQRFSISPNRSIGRPTGLMKTLPRRNLFVWQMLVGTEALRLRRYERALVYLEKAIQQKPKYLPLYQTLFDAYLRIGYYERVFQALEKAPESLRAPLQIYAFLAQVVQNPSCEQHMPVMKKAYEKGVRHWLMLRLMGDCFFSHGDKEKALLLYQDSLHLNPDQKALQEKVKILLSKLQTDKSPRS